MLTLVGPVQDRVIEARKVFMRRIRVVLRACVFALAVSLVLATSAFAAATDDTIVANPTGTTDVLANDTGTDALTVASNTQPAHGTATCKPLGGCLYTA